MSNHWNDRRVLVTGASGLMGGWLVKALLERGADVVALVRDSVPSSLLRSEGLEDRVTLVRGDLKDLGQMRRVVAEYEVRTVFHLAAQPIVGVAKKDPVGTLEDNVRGTWNVLEACRQPHVECVAFASSDKAYGSSEELPYKETHPLQGRYPYDVSKSCADLIARMYAETFDLPTVTLRCANLFGGGDLNFNRVVPGAIAATARGRRFEIRSDGRFVRDYLYVEDAADGYLAVAEKTALDPSLRGEAFNLSGGMRLTVLDVTARVLALMGRLDLEPIILNQASGEIREQYLDDSKIREQIGWRARHDLDEGLRKTIAWYEHHLAGAESRAVGVA